MNGLTLLILMTSIFIIGLIANKIGDLNQINRELNNENIVLRTQRQTVKINRIQDYNFADGKGQEQRAYDANKLYNVKVG